LAALAMLPTMALLPWMAEACRRGMIAVGLGPRSLVALHLLVMLLPAWWPRRWPAAAVAALLVGGAVLAFAVPDGSGPMGAIALQTEAWGRVWREAVVPGPRPAPRGHGAGLLAALAWAADAESRRQAVGRRSIAKGAGWTWPSP
jgi:hypothetical protein